jgi:hypothetical protein
MNEPLFDWTKKGVKERMGHRFDSELATYLGIKRGAVWAWPEDKDIPEGRQWQLRALRPDLFPLPKPDIASAAA